MEDRVHDVAIDDAGNTYIAGIYRHGSGGGTAVIHAANGATTLPATSLTNPQYFFAKYDPAGNLLFVKVLAGSALSNTEGRMNLALDGGQNIYLTGHLFNSMDLDPSSASVIVYAANSNIDGLMGTILGFFPPLQGTGKAFMIADLGRVLTAGRFEHFSFYFFGFL